MTTYVDGLETALGGQVRVNSGVVQVNRQSEWANARGKEVYDASEYATLAACLTAAGADAIVYVPPQTFSEAVTVSSNNVTLQGSGRTSLIDGGTTGHAIAVTGTDVVIENLAVQTTAAGGNNYDCLDIGAVRCTINKLIIIDSDQDGIALDSADDSKIINCKFLTSDRIQIIVGLSSANTRIIIAGNDFNSPNSTAIQLRSANLTTYSVVNSNYVTSSDTVNPLVYNDGDYNVLVGNVINATGASTHTGLNSNGDNSLLNGNVVNTVSAAAGDAIDLAASSNDNCCVGNAIDVAVDDNGASNTSANNEVF